MAWILRFDGLCEPVNPGGISTYGFEVWRDGARVHEEHGLVSPPDPRSTSNVAEYVGLLRGLAWLATQDLADEPVTIHGDSKLVVEQVAGRWRVGNEELVPLRREAADLLARLPSATLAWVPREENGHADGLTQRAYEEALREHPEWLAAARSQPASGKQRERLRELGITFHDDIDRREASRMIDRAEREIRRQARAAAEAAERGG